MSTDETDDLSVGDAIEARQGETVIRGTVVYIRGARALEAPALDWAGGDAPGLGWLKRKGWTLTLVERAKPVYEPGVYLPGEYWARKYAETGYLPNLWVYADGKWWNVPNTWGSRDNGPRPLDTTKSDVSKAVRLAVSA